jgi:hypothetical protein
MANLLIITLLTLGSIITPWSGSSALQTNGEIRPGFNPTGYFFFSGSAPRVFKEVKRIDLSTADTKQDLRGRIRWFNVRPHGSVVAGQVFKMARLSFDGLQFSFATVTVGGTNYQFTGNFQKEGIYYDAQPEGVVLKGKLSRMRGGGKAVAEQDVEFIWTGGD